VVRGRKEPDQPGYSLDPSRLIQKLQQKLAEVNSQLIVVETAFDQLNEECTQLKKQVAELTDRLAEYTNDKKDDNANPEA
jgi:septal ring factor EnvC (AmiA/AmiB activator)